MARLPLNPALYEAARPVDISGDDAPEGGVARLTNAQQAALYYARKRRKARMKSSDPVNPDPDTSPLVPMTVFAGVDMQSGDSGYYSTVYGSISNEPLADYPLLEFATRNTNYAQVAFTGDCTAIVAGWMPVIPGVTLGEVISDWAFDGEHTTATWECQGSMGQSQEYPITWVASN